MKKSDDAVVTLVFFTGVSSVVSQLLLIREFLAQFSGNEFVIALIFFNWLVLTGLGTLVATYGAGLNRSRVSADTLTISSYFLSCFPVVQILFLRYLKSVFFIHGTSHGFYPVMGFSFALMAPYCIVMGFVLPYSLFLLRQYYPPKSGTFVYLVDGMGDVTGGALFSFVLIFFFTPCGSLILSGMLLYLGTIYFSRVCKGSPCVTLMVPAVFATGFFLEGPSLEPQEGTLVDLKESLYGRIAVHEEQDQFTLFADGVPMVSSSHTALAREIVHYAMCQIPVSDDVLLLSGEAGIMAEIFKYHAKRIRYIELDPDVSRALINYGMITPIPGMIIINEDARKWLSRTDEIFHAVLMNMPEPDTFQANRFYTDEFFHLVHARMADTGIFGFHMDGYDAYITDAQLAKVSVIHATLKNHFPHVALIPSDNLFFLCRNYPIDMDIPKCLADKGISAPYLTNTYYGNVSRMKTDMLVQIIDHTAPINQDQAPRLIPIVYGTWFEKFNTSPLVFALVIACLCVFYLFSVSRGQYVLYTTGVVAMGSEILIIFLYQILWLHLFQDRHDRYAVSGRPSAWRLFR